jgi:hypothetical protein
MSEVMILVTEWKSQWMYSSCGCNKCCRWHRQHVTEVTYVFFCVVHRHFEHCAASFMHRWRGRQAHTVFSDGVSIQTYSVYGRWMVMNMEHWWNYNWQGKTESLTGNPVSVPLSQDNKHSDSIQARKFFENLRYWDLRSSGILRRVKW